jgi:mannosyltransferase
VATEDRAVLATLVGVVVAAALLRFATLDRQSLWSDEAMTAALTRLGFGEMLRTIPQSESTPPLYYVVTWLWTRIFGHGEVGLRSLSALAGTLTVPATFQAGRAFASARAGLAAAAVVTVSPPLVWYSQEARSYALAVLLCAVSFAALARVLERPTGRWACIWAGASVLALATHYFAGFVVAAEAVWLTLRHRSSPPVRRALAALAIAAVAVGVFAIDQRRNGLSRFIGVTAPLRERIQVLGKQLLVGESLPWEHAAAAAVALALVAGLILTALRGSARERRAVVVAGSVGLAPILVPIVLAVAGLDYLNTRNTLVGSVPLACAATVGLALARARLLGPALLTAACAVLLAITLDVAVDPAYQRPDWRGFARDVDRGSLPRVLVVTPDHETWFARIPLQYYLPHAHAIDAALVHDVTQLRRVSRRPGDRSAPTRIAVREVVVGEVGWTPPARPTGLPRVFRLVERRSGHGYELLRFRSPRPVTIPTALLETSQPAVLLQESR